MLLILLLPQAVDSGQPEPEPFVVQECEEWIAKKGSFIMVCIKDEYLEYLDELRDSGDVNMFGAGPYLREEFPELNKQDSWAVLKHWQDTFADRHNL